MQVIYIILNLATALIFFFLGRLSRVENDPVVEALQDKLFNKPKEGNLKFKQPDEIKYDKSVDKRVEDEWGKLKL